MQTLALLENSRKLKESEIQQYPIVALGYASVKYRFYREYYAFSHR